jgi:hypothetical protein
MCGVFILHSDPTRTRLIYLPPPNHPPPATHLPIGSAPALPEPGPG